jgi:lipoate synthase
MAEHVRKPDWLKIRLGGNEKFTQTKEIVESHSLHTICTSGKCPNMGECWERGTATFMIGGGAGLVATSNGAFTYRNRRGPLYFALGT